MSFLLSDVHQQNDTSASRQVITSRTIRYIRWTQAAQYHSNHKVEFCSTPDSGSYYTIGRTRHRRMRVPLGRRWHSYAVLNPCIEQIQSAASFRYP